jgi:uncharacterized lipoprotein YmbA
VQKKTVVFLLIVFLSSCAMPETRIYSLNMSNPSSGKEDSGETGTKANAAVVVTVSSPRYLSQPYIAYRSSPYQLAVSKYSKWDSPPDELVREAFKDSLLSTRMFGEVRTSHIVPGGFYSLKVNLRRFERLDDGDLSFGEVVFDVSFLSPDGVSLYGESYKGRTKLEDRSFLSLAKGLSSTLGEGVRETGENIAKSLRR